MRCLVLTLFVLLFALERGWANDTVKIGLAAPFVGPFEVYARQQAVGMEFAVRRLNEYGGILGKRVEIIKVDDGCQTAHAERAAVQLLEADVVAVVGHICGNAAEIAASAYEQHDLALLTLTSWPSLTEKNRPNIVRICGRLDQQAHFAASYLTTRYEEKEVAGVFSNDPYGQLAQGFTRGLIHSNTILRDLTIRNDHSPVEALLQEFTNRGVQGVMMYGATADVAADLTNGAQSQNLDIEFVFDGVAITSRFRALAAQSTDGVKYNLSCYVPVVDPTLESRIGESLVQDIRDELAAKEKSSTFQKREGELGYALHSFAAVQVLAAAAASSGSLESKDLSESIRTGSFETVVGDFSFDDHGDVSYSTGERGYVQQYFYRWFMLMAGEDVPWTDSDPCPEEEQSTVAGL